MAKEKHKVLLAEDDESDRKLLQRAFQQVSRLELAGMVENGAEVIAYIAGTGQYADRQQFPFPDLLLLDLKLPGKTGFEVLEWLQQQPFPQLKVVVLSGSIDPVEIQKAIHLGAQLYRTKPVDLQSLVDLVKSLEGYMTKTPRE